MRIIVKGLKGFDVYEQTEDYIMKKFNKYEKMVKDPTVLEFSFDHTHASKQTLDKVIHLTATMPGLKKPEHLEEIGIHFEEAIDLLQERFDKFITRWKDKKKEGKREPKKYFVADKLAQEAGEI